MESNQQSQSQSNLREFDVMYDVCTGNLSAPGAVRKRGRRVSGQNAKWNMEQAAPDAVADAAAAADAVCRCRWLWHTLPMLRCLDAPLRMRPMLLRVWAPSAIGQATKPLWAHTSASLHLPNGNLHLPLLPPTLAPTNESRTRATRRATKRARGESAKRSKTTMTIVSPF